MTNRFAKRNNCLLVLELSKVSLRLDKKENFRLGKAVFLSFFSKKRPDFLSSRTVGAIYVMPIGFLKLYRSFF